MTDKAPKRVWRDEPFHAGGYAHGMASWPDREYASPNVTEYIRADIVTELVDALEGIIAITDRNHVAWHAAHAALAKAKDAEQ